MMPSAFDAAQYWQDRLSTQYDLQGVGYASLGRSYNHWMYAVRAHVFRRLLRSLRLDVAGLAVLDIGSGTGFYIEQWNRLRAQVTGVDFAPVAVNHLKVRFPRNRFYQADISASLPPGDTYDVVSAFDVLFHIVDDAKFGSAIQNIHGVLRAGGLFIFSDNFVHQAPIRMPHHVSRSLESICQTLTDNGFQVLKRVPMFSFMNAPLDSTSRYREKAWQLMARVISSSEAAGFVLGALLFPLELLLTRRNESATTEIMVCRKAKS